MRDKSGRFIPGQSGNPDGRPRTESAELRESLRKHGPALISKAVKLALAGDVQALSICLSRICPPLRPTAAPVHFTIDGDSPADTAKSIVFSTASGEMSPDTCAQLLAAVGSLQKILEIEELETRLKVLEDQINAPN